MKVYRYLVKEGKPLELDETFAYSPEDCANDHPLLEIPSAHLTGAISNVDDFLTAEVRVEGEMILSDARSGKPFLQKFSTHELIDLLEDVNEQGEGYIFPGTHFAPEDLTHRIVRSLVPIAPHEGEVEILEGEIDDSDPEPIKK